MDKEISYELTPELKQSLITAWLNSMYKEARDDHLAKATHEHLCALGSPDNETAIMHEQMADVHRQFARIMNNLITEEMTNANVYH